MEKGAKPYRAVNWWRRWAASAVDAVFPPACLWCERPQHSSGLCGPCVAKMGQFGQARCARCAAPLPGAEGAECPQCREACWSFERVLALGTYTETLRSVVLRLKHAESHALAFHVGLLLGQHARSEWQRVPEFLVPVPMYWYRRFRRGINSASALARGVSAALGSPVVADTVWCCRSTRKQSMLSAAERTANVRGAFACLPAPPWVGRTVAIIDDTMTTGATCNELAGLLRQQGAGSVDVLVAARAIAEWKRSRPAGGQGRRRPPPAVSHAASSPETP